MIWNISFPLSLIILFLGFFIAFRLFRNKNMQNNDTLGFFALAISVFLSLTVMHFALEYSEQYIREPSGWITAVLVAVRDTIGAFVVDGDFAFYGEHLQGMVSWAVPICSVTMAIMTILAPVFTFGFLLSFFKNLSSLIRFSHKRNENVYVFSELNDKALVLAADLKKNNPDRVIVFCDVFEQDDERFGELLEKAKKLDAIFFDKDVLDIDFNKHVKRGALYFMITGQDDAENINQSFGLAERYGQYDTTHLYLFADSISGELLLFSGKKYKMKIRRVNESLALIQNALYHDPTCVFENTHATTPEGDRVISAVLVGLGGYGMESLKTLLWYGQMDGYRLKIDAFEQSEDAEQRVIYQCPEVMSERYNGKYKPGEAYYQVKVHGGVSVGTARFAQEIAKLTEASFVLVSLGNDDLNIETAVGLRTMFERMHIHPSIYAVVHNARLAACLQEATNYRGQPYQIKWIGGLEHSYSESVIFHNELEKAALDIHCLGYGGTQEDFYAYEYNYRSSTASALHNRARARLGISGADLPPEQRTPEQEAVLMNLEHCRWNAYMRSIGYVYSGSKDAATRNDLGKMHHNLVQYEELTEQEQNKDRGVSRVDLSSESGN